MAMSLSAPPDKVTLYCCRMCPITSAPTVNAYFEPKHDLQERKHQLLAHFRLGVHAEVAREATIQFHPFLHSDYSSRRQQRAQEIYSSCLECMARNLT